MALRLALPSLAALCALPLACGGAPAAPQAPAAAKPVASAPPPPPPDLSPVPDPQGLVVTGRLSKAGASLGIVHGWSKLPMPESAQVTELVTSEAIGPVVDIDQPIDFAVAVSGSGMQLHPVVAVSAAVKDPDKVKASLADRYKLVPGDNGTTLIQGLGKPAPADDDQDGSPDDGGGSERTCELAPAYGAAPVRLVCGFSPKALTELGPWLTRTATRAPSTDADAHLEVRMAPLKPTIEEQKRFLGLLIGGVLGGQAAGTGDVLSVAAGDLADFALDLDTLDVDLMLADPGANLTTTLKLSGSTSELGKLMTGHAERSGPVPAEFWQLPGDADLAFFDRGLDDAQVAKGRDLALKLASDALGDQGIKDADRKPILDALGKLASPAPVAYASGLDPAATQKAFAAEKALGDQADASSRAEAKRASAEALLGWRVIELGEPSARIAGALKDLSAAWGKPSVVAAYRAKHPGAPPPSLRTAPLPKGTKLPAGTQHYVLSLYSYAPERRVTHPARGASQPKAADKKPAKPGRPLVLHLLVVPDGQRTWFASGGDEGLVAAKVAAAMAGGGDTLSARPELASLKTAAVGAGGFVTVRGLPEMVEQLAVLFGATSHDAMRSLEDAQKLPHQGLVAMPFTLTAQANGPSHGAVTTMQVPRAAIEDAIAGFLQHGGF